MKKSKKALLAVIACTVALSGAAGLAACKKTNGGNTTPTHTHSWSSWTVEEANKPAADKAGKATRTCSGEGDCNAEASDKEHALPALNETDYAKGADSATCSAAGEVTYTYNKDGVNVSVTVDTPVNSEAHAYGEYVNSDPEGHYQVCENNSQHVTDKVAHDTEGTDGVCSVCGYKEEAVDPAVETITVGDKVIASLNTTGVTLYFEDCEAGKNYKLSSTNDKVKFYVGIEQGNPVEFEYSVGTVAVNVVSVEGILTDVTVTLEEVEPVPDEFQLIELDTEVTVTEAGAFTPQKYKIELEDGAYQILVGGKAIALTADAAVLIGNGYSSLELDAVETAIGYDSIFGVSDSYPYYPAGTFYIEAYENVTFKITAVEDIHLHELDEENWASNNNGHYHPAICGEGGSHGSIIKGPISVHTFGEWSEPDEDGVRNKACTVCGYSVMEVVSGTRVSGGRTESNAGTISAAGKYIATITSAKDSTSGKYSPAGEFYNIVCGGTAKKYTVKLLSGNSAITPDAAGYDAITEVGSMFTFVLEAGEKFLFNVSTLDMEVLQNYSFDVAFMVTEEDAPEAGDILRPVIAVSGDNGKESVTAGEKVYFQISNSKFSDDLVITFGADVTVYNLGLKITNGGTPIASGDKIPANDFKYGKIYLCATSIGSDCKINIVEQAALGSRNNPIEVTTEGENSATISQSSAEQWFVFTSAEGGTFEFKSNDEDGRLAAYKGDSTSSSSAGATIIVELGAGETVYIRAYHNLNKSFTFNVSATTQSSAGTSASDPIIFTESGEYTLPPKATVITVYCTFTAEVASTIEITYTPDPEVSTDKITITCMAVGLRKVVNTATINAKAGTTYSIMLVTNATTQTPLKVSVNITPNA